MLNPTLYPKEKLSYDTEKDLAPITGLVRINQALIANNGLAANNVSELIELAKKKPGEITYGTAGVGSAPHMNMIKFENMAKREAAGRSTIAAPRPRSTTSSPATST